jgi:hypothetical protein
MDDALEESIRVWRENVQAEWWLQVKMGPTHCALCREYRTVDGCGECPVKAATGENGCLGSPYYEAVGQIRGPRSAVSAYAREKLQDELTFLEGLRK